jgi:hypothetical protein
MLLDSGTLTLTGGQDSVFSAVGAMAFVVRLDLSNLVATDTVVIRYEATLDGGGPVVSKSWEIVYGTTTGPDWVGAFGSEGDGWDSPVLWFAISGEVTIEQTVGTPVDVDWEAVRVKVLA